MISQLSTFILILLLVPPSSFSLPVPVDKEITQKEKEAAPAVASKEEKDVPAVPANDQPRRERREMEDVEGEDPDPAFSPDTIDTMRKMNPLTIGNQVANMFRKKNNIVSKHSLSSAQSSIKGEGPSVEEQAKVSFDEEPERQPMYSKHEPHGREEKTPNDDYGYSVIVMAGEPVKIPLKFNGKQPQVKKIAAGAREDGGRESFAVRVNGVSAGGKPEEKIQVKEPFLGKEMRVPKQFCVNPEFPVYDEDINFIPDPFNGILNDNYWSEGSHTERVQQVKAWPEGDPMRWGSWDNPHMMQLRSIDVSKDEKVMSDASSCGSWKNNGTKLEAPQAVQAVGTT